MCSGTKNGGIYQLQNMVRYCAFVCVVEAKETANVDVAIEVMCVCRPAVLGKNTCQHAECYIVMLSI